MRTILIMLFASAIVCKSQAQQVHAFLFCKTNDKTIGRSVRINFMNMREQIQLISSALQMPYVEHAVTGPQFTVSNVESILDNANINRDDIVFLYFSTHGVKSRYDSNIFPQLDIPEELVSAYKKHKGILNQRPKFLITVIEACSGYQEITPQEAFVFEQGEIPSYDALTASQIKNIKKLFESECEIIITAGNPGKNTWATPYGSMFTNCFLRSMTEHFDMPQAKAKKVSWDNLLNQAKVYTYNMTKTTRIKYYPVWEKRNCNGLVEQSLTDTSNVVQRDVTLNIATKKTWRFKNPYNVDLDISNNSGIPIDSVVYYLHVTMENPTLPKYNQHDNFYVRLNLWGTFPIKAKVYFSDGQIVDLYKNFTFKNRQEN